VPNIIAIIMNHSERSSLLTNILNDQSPWLFKTLSALSVNGPVEGMRIRDLLNEHIQTSGRFPRRSVSSQKPSHRDLLKDPEILWTVMNYFMRTLVGKCGDRSSLAVFAAIFVTLERKEDDFEKFMRNHPELDCTGALVLFWTLFSPPEEEPVEEVTA